MVPPELRTSVYAFDKTVAGLLGALAAPLVGVLADHVFGYKESRPAVGAAENATTHNVSD